MSHDAAYWLQKIRALDLPPRVKIMNVCGGHERSITLACLRQWPDLRRNRCWRRLIQYCASYWLSGLFSITVIHSWCDPVATSARGINWRRRWTWSMPTGAAWA